MPGNSAELNILETWFANASPWIAAIQNQSIESRRLVTDQAIVDAIQQYHPQHLLDAGCGEGWLVRRLCQLGMDCLGVDPVPAFIEYARKAGAGNYQTLGFEALDQLQYPHPFDVICCNFSLLGESSVEALFRQACRLLSPCGKLIVQTIHPHTSSQSQPNKSGWITGSWCGIAGDFSAPAPWFFRTLDNWQELFAAHDLALVETLEPRWPDREEPASIIFIGQPQSSYGNHSGA